MGNWTSWATALPRSVITTGSPAAASATTAEAFCLRALIPTVFMYFIVAHRAVRSRRVNFDDVVVDPGEIAIGSTFGIRSALPRKSARTTPLSSLALAVALGRVSGFERGCDGVSGELAACGLNLDAASLAHGDVDPESG